MVIAPLKISAQRGYVTGAGGSEVREQGALTKDVAGLDLQAGAQLFQCVEMKWGRRQRQGLDYAWPLGHVRSLNFILKAAELLH